MDQGIVDKALENLFTSTGVVGDVRRHEHSDTDGVLRLMFKKHAVKIPFLIKSNINVNTVSKLKKAFAETILIFPSSSKDVKEKLRENGVNYLEESGNVFLNTEDFYLFVDVNKSAKHSKTKYSKAFSKTGLKVVFLLLSDKNAITYSYRKIAEIAGVSLDSVGRVIRELITDKYIVRYNEHGYRFFDLERLVNDWATVFNKTLRPKLKARRFDFKENDGLKQLLDRNYKKATIGGELAADVISNYLIAERANVYTNDSFVDFALANNLVPAKNGKITLIEKFWTESHNPKNQSQAEIAAAALVYADLLDVPTPRNLETARIILERMTHEFA